MNVKQLLGILRAGVLLMLAGSWLTQETIAQTVYENYTFVTLAGPGMTGAGWFDGDGSDARFNGPVGMARDANGNIYVGDSANNAIRKITPDGKVTTLAGLAGSSGKIDGIGAAARFNSPFGVAVDNNGNVYVADRNNHAIRKISPAGVVTTFAGRLGVQGAVNGTGSAASFRFPFGLTIDSGNNLYVADAGNDLIRKITPAGVVTTLAGSAGVAGSADKTGTKATFNAPFGITVDANGNVYVADTGNNAIRKITPTGVVTTLAGKAGTTGSTDDSKDAARFDSPEGITVDQNFNVYVADSFNHTIRKITPAGDVTTPLGFAEKQGSVDDTGNSARFNVPIGIIVDDNTNLYIADFSNSSIRKANAGLAVTTIAGLAGGLGSVDATGSAARFNFPSSVAVDGNGFVFVTDFANQTIRKITPGGTATTFAGTVGVKGTNNGNGLAAEFNSPAGLAVDNGGNVYVADSINNAIRKITSLGDVTTLAGFPGTASANVGTNDGVGTDARFKSPLAVTVDTNGTVYVTDTGNNTVRSITPAGVVATLAGTPGAAGTNDGSGLSAKFNSPEGVTIGNDHNLYIVDDGSSTIRQIAPDASVTTFAGAPGVTGSADGAGSAATFNSPFGVAADVDGNLYISDTGNNTIRKVTPAGVVTTIGGSPAQAGSLDGTGSDAQFNFPEGLAVDSQGNVYIADASNHSIRKGYPALPDSPTVDLVAAHVGVTRHFSIANMTTTSWAWRIVRRPANSTAQLSSTNTPNPTFTPDVEDAYVIQFQGTDNSGRTTIRRLTLYADNTAPSLSITNPVSGQVTSNGVFTVRGTAADNLSLSNVWVQANGGAWVQATGTTNWSSDVTLLKGTNVVRAYAQDLAGNVSTTNEVDFFYIVSAPLTVHINGGGTVTPNLNGVLLEIGKGYSITAVAGKGSAFVNWTGSITTNSPTLSFIMESNLTFTANFTDTLSPAVTITSPKKGLSVSNAIFTATGTATDNGQLDAVWYQLNGGAWIQATNTSNWTAGLALVAGANTLRVYAVDTFNNFSTTNSVAFTYVPSGQITIIQSGQGTLTPNYNGWYLQIGKSYTMTAKAGFGNIFSNWVDNAGITLSTAPALTFIVQSNTTFHANFSVNPFGPLIGTFSGLFYETNNVTVTNSGSVSISLTDAGGFSAKLLFGSGKSVSLSGRFSPDCVFSNSITPKGSTPFIVQLKLDTVSGRMIGSISNSGWAAQLMAVRAAFSSANPAPQANKKYTLVIPGGDDSSVQPGGNGYGTVSVNVSGNVTFSGVLGDGTKATQKTTVSKQNQWPFYVAPYKGQGVALGWLTFTNESNSDLSGLIYWVKLPQPTAKLYPGGFNFANGIPVMGSLYSFTNGIPLLNLPAGGVVILQQGNLPQSFTNNFTLGSDNKATSANGLSLTITTTSGLFKGTAHNPGDGSSVPINGVLLQKQNTAFGAFLGTSQSGSVYFGP